MNFGRGDAQEQYPVPGWSGLPDPWNGELQVFSFSVEQKGQNSILQEEKPSGISPTALRGQSHRFVIVGLIGLHTR